MYVRTQNMWEDNSTQIQSQCLPIPGRDLESAGVTSFCDLTIEDQNIFDKYKHVIYKRIRQEKDLHFPENFEFVPTSVAKQIESHDNCYFHIDLPHSIITIKIIPNPHITDLSKHITLHREAFTPRQPSINELVL